MQTRDKIILIVYIAIQSSSVLTFLISTVSEIKEISYDAYSFFIIFFVVAPIIAFAIYLFLRINFVNSKKRRAFIYASKSEILLKRTNLSSTLFNEGEINLAKERIKEDEEKNAMNRYKFHNLAVSIIIAYVLFTGVNLVMLIISQASASAYFISIFAITALAVFIFLFTYYDLRPKPKPTFDEEVVDAIKKYDEEDDDIRIIDYKIYNKEMFIELPIKESRMYCLISKKKLAMVVLNKVQIKQRDSLNNDADIDLTDGEMKREFKCIYKRASIYEYKVKDKNIYEVLELIKNHALESSKRVI